MMLALQSATMILLVSFNLLLVAKSSLQTGYHSAWEMQVSKDTNIQF